MPTKISSSEVLAYLNYLGYNNVNAQQLKEFIQDLKKLIKYEERKRSEGNILEQDGTSTYTEITDTQEPFPDIFATLHAHATIASRAKVVPKKESVISVQIKKSKPHVHCIDHNKENVNNASSKTSHIDSNNSQEKDVIELDNQQSQNSNKSENSRNRDKDENQETQRKQSSTSNEYKKFESNKKQKAKASFIRPPIQMNKRSDPVALYHQYCAEWKRQKIPGEDNRTDLRWAIREKMLSGPR